jgi:hypothetical protein
MLSDELTVNLLVGYDIFVAVLLLRKLVIIISWAIKENLVSTTKQMGMS